MVPSSGLGQKLHTDTLKEREEKEGDLEKLKINVKIFMFPPKIPPLRKLKQEIAIIGYSKVSIKLIYYSTCHIEYQRATHQKELM